MRFRLVPKSSTLDDLELLYVQIPKSSTLDDLELLYVQIFAEFYASWNV